MGQPGIQAGDTRLPTGAQRVSVGHCITLSTIKITAKSVYNCFIVSRVIALYIDIYGGTPVCYLPLEVVRGAYL